MRFSPDELVINGTEVESIMVPLYFFVKTSRKKLISKFELEGRGRAYSFEPIEDFENGKQLEITMVQKL